MSAINRFLTYYCIDVDLPSENTYRAPSLQSNDFISSDELSALLQSMRKPIHSIARDTLINRNLAIVHLIRYNGLRPKEIAFIDMRMINLAQSTIEFESNGQQTTYTLSGKHIRYIRDYYQSIDLIKRPTWKSNDPLFVSFNNRSHDFQYDYAAEQPKQLSVRSIQEMIKDEVQLAGLRQLSAKHLRNSCILDYLSGGHGDKIIQNYFHLTHRYSLQRYKDYNESVANIKN